MPKNCSYLGHSMQCFWSAQFVPLCRGAIDRERNWLCGVSLCCRARARAQYLHFPIGFERPRIIGPVAICAWHKALKERNCSHAFDVYNCQVAPFRRYAREKESKLSHSPAPINIMVHLRCTTAARKSRRVTAAKSEINLISALFAPISGRSK